LYQKSVDKQVQKDKFEVHFITQPTDASCSKDVPMEHNEDVLTKYNNEKIPPQSDNILSTNDMLMKFESNGMFGDMN
jgi:hypothetical protein